MFDLSTTNNTNAAAVAATPTETALVPVDVDGREMIADLTTATTSYCSILPETVSDKIRIYNAMANADEKLRDHVGETLNVRHVYVEAIQCRDDKTGEVATCPRVILITREGVTFQAVSTGVFSSLRQIFGIFGEPSTWGFSLTLKVRETTTRRGYRVVTLEAVGVINDDEPADGETKKKK